MVPSLQKKFAFGVFPLLVGCVALTLVLLTCGTADIVDRADDGTPILLRSSQPGVRNLTEWHDEHGVKTVINLRGPNYDEEWYLQEKEGVKKIGARWIQLRVSGSKAPTPEVLADFFDIVEQPENWPILIHCQGGIHRTGVMAGLYRMQYQGWDGDRTVAELESYGFDWTTRDRTALKRFLRAYRRDPTRRIDRSAHHEKRTATALRR